MSVLSIFKKSEATAIVEDSISRGKTTRDGAAEVAAALACRYYESIPEQVADMAAYYAPVYAKESNWHTTRPKVAYNLTRAIADECGQRYNRPVQRKFAVKADETTWAEIGGGFTPLMQNVDRFTFLSGLVAARPVVMPDYRMAWTYYTRDQIEYVPDALDPNTPHWLVVSFRHGHNIIKHWWSATHYVRTVDDVQQYTAEEELAYPGGRHNYGRIPLVLFRNDACGRQFFGEPATDLVSANRTINHLTTRLNWTMHFQGASTLVQVGGDPSAVIKIGAESKVGIPAGADLKYISPDPAIEATIGAINHNLQLLCRSRRIPEDGFLLSRQSESGVALVARAAPMEDYRQGRGELFMPQEIDLIQLSLLVWRMSKSEGRIKPGAVSISYEKPVRPMAPELTAELQWLKRENIITAADILIAREPGLSRPEALKRIEENRKENEANAPKIEAPVFKNAKDESGDVSDGEPVSAVSVAADPEAKVQETALNGAQVESLREIMTSVSDGTLAKPAAKILIRLAFPLFDESEIDAMVNASVAVRTVRNGDE